jgi:hypothetical protein
VRVPLTVRAGMNQHKERVIHPLWSYIFDGNFAVKAVPRTSDEMRSNCFGYVDRAVRKNGNLSREFFDAQFFAWQRRGKEM